MFQIELTFGGRKHVVGSGFASVEDAWWAVSAWRQQNQCMLDNAFHVVPMPVLTFEDDGEDTTEFPTPIIACEAVTL